MDFGAWMMTSGMVLNDEVKWISFHSYYDFGYLVKLLTQEELPAVEGDFFDLLKLYFPVRNQIRRPQAKTHALLLAFPLLSASLPPTPRALLTRAVVSQCVYDIKYLMKSCEALKGGLNKVAETLKVKRVGPTHQAGSDSLVTSLSFFKMRRLFFDDQIEDTKYLGVLYGLGQGGHSAPIPWNE